MTNKQGKKVKIVGWMYFGDLNKHETSRFLYKKRPDRSITWSKVEVRLSQKQKGKK